MNVTGWDARRGLKDRPWARGAMCREREEEREGVGRKRVGGKEALG